MVRAAFFAYGVACHLLFLAVYAWFAGFVGNFLVPHSIDSGPNVPLASAVAIDLGLLFLFGLQHSVMARPAFKRIWTRFIPEPIERSTYVLASCLVLMLLIWQWRPINVVVWNVQQPAAWGLLTGMFAAGWLGVPLVSLMINHFDLFGTRQVWLYSQGRPYTSLPFATPLAYHWVRHPLYVAWAFACWAAPTMTVGHLLFAVVLTLYMVAASHVEERDLVDYFGQEYEEYRRRVPAFVPIPRRLSVQPTSESASAISPKGM
jgi:protein-S-isoprenylcysteine O-methyltransferase Ste14